MDPDASLDPNPVFSDFKDVKKIIFSYFFLINYPQAHYRYLQSQKFNFLLTFCFKILFCKHYFSPLNTFMSKGKNPDPDVDLYL